MTQHQNPVRKKKKHKIWPWLVLLLLIAAAVWLYASTAQVAQQSLTEEVAARRDIVTYYSFEGNLTPQVDEIQTAKESLKVKELYVAEGDRVEEGQALLRGTDGSRIYAAYTGTVDTLYVELDDTLQPGSQLARIVDYQNLEVSVDVDEYDIGALTEGKEGMVYLNALEKQIPGKVTDIARDAISEGGVSFYEVKFGVEALNDVRSGMSVEVQVLNQQALSVVSLPLDAISYDEYNKPYVLKKDAEGNLLKAEITLGVSDGKNVEIVSGVEDGESVFYLSNDLARFFAMRNQMMGGR
ncbi:MAG: HlyD family efflux transporter periplasmic adaptor subunit [Clostridiales bacterium]|nr:HlyD family efflux transporter periplasmic adaptor subunit [Clostridiales bacterium]